ncbi:MAG: tetratricopeptide repeat protein [Myxococcales bacterium]|nr:tetratricopeptide repeat protein [Myxococcales bacterium]
MRPPRRACSLALLFVLVLTTPVGAQQSRRAGVLPAAERALSEGRYADAERGFASIEKGPRLGAALLGLARTQLATGRYEQSEKSAAAAAAVPGHRSQGETLRGEALMARGELDAAQRAFERAIGEPTAYRARVLLGRLLMARGRVDAAVPHLHHLIDAYNDDAIGGGQAAELSYVAMAARALGSFHDANDAFRDAALADRSRVETQIEWAELFLEKYDQRHASESVEEALEHNPHSPEARVLMARLLLRRAYDFEGAEEQLERALHVNPKLVSAHVIRAAIALRNMELADADAHLDRALAINAHDLEALSVRAAVRFLADDARGFAAAKKQVLARNRRFSRMFSIIAEYAEWEHRYPELVAMAREALRIDSDDALAHATLGFNLLRMGEEKAGLEALRASWSRDRFNVHVFNTLNLFDEVIGPNYERYQVGPFNVRIHRDERKVLEPYLGPMLKRAYADMRKRYRFTPKGPLHLELFADRQHFSVRTTGLPNVGVQGVCFGKVVTAVSPAAGSFNWGQITWHELAHIFHLQLSDNHVPRWFTEGLAEYETIIARPEWRREEDHNLHAALAMGKLPKLADLNRAFTHAKTPQALMTAYYAASQAVVYIVERFGFERVRPMLEAWGRGVRTEEVFERVLGVGLEQLDADFRAHLDKQLARFHGRFMVDFSRYEKLDALRAAVAKNPKDIEAQAALAMGLVVAREFDEAEKVGMKVIKRDGDNALAHFAMTRVALEKGDAERAGRCLRGVLKSGQDGYVLRVLLARAALASKDPRGARIHGEAAVGLDPDQLEGYRILLEVAEKLEDRALARSSLEAIARLDQHDRLAQVALMELLGKLEDWPALAALEQRVLYIDPGNARVHQLLGRALLEQGEAKRALAELDQALLLGHRRPGRLELLRARALSALGRGKQAKEAAQRAVEHDPKLQKDVEALPKGAAKE